MTKAPPSPDRNLLGPWTPWIVVVVALAAAGVFLAVWRGSGRDKESAGLSGAFDYDVEKYRHIPDDQIGYSQTAIVETGLEAATALAVGPEDEIVVGGDRKVLVFSPEGEQRSSVDLDESPLALTVSSRGWIYAAFRNRVVAGGPTGPFFPFVTLPGDRARITSVAVAPERVFVADAGSRDVWVFTPDRSFLGTFGERDPDRDGPLFNVPSPYFDILMAKDGLLRVVDPGRHRVTAFTPEGDLELAWGQASFKLAGFGGCCNPSHLAMLPDGAFVTSEKGIPRVKVHDARGAFVTAVVGATGLSTEKEPCDVAADSRGRILVLDPGANVVRVFEPKGGTGR